MIISGAIVFSNAAEGQTLETSRGARQYLLSALLICNSSALGSFKSVRVESYEFDT